MKRLIYFLLPLPALFLLSSCFEFGSSGPVAVGALRIDNQSDYKLSIVAEYLPHGKAVMQTLSLELEPDSRGYLNVMYVGCVNPDFSSIFGSDISVFKGEAVFTDAGTGEEVCRYELGSEADNALCRDLFDESQWDVLDGAEFPAGDTGVMNARPYRMWTLTVTDEYL